MSGRLPGNARQLVLALSFVACQSAIAQELATLRSEVRELSDIQSAAAAEPKRRKNRSKMRLTDSPCSPPSNDVDCDEAGSLLNFFVGEFMAGVSSPFWGPRAVVGDDSLDPGYFLRYPYLHENEGAISELRYAIEGSRTWMLRARTDYVDDFDAQSKIGGALQLDTASRWGIESEANYRRELVEASRDHLWTGDTNFLFRFAQHEQIQLRTGLGVNWLADTEGTDLGFNFTYGGDWFPVEPIIVSHEIDWGRLGSAGLFHARITVGVNYHRLEIFTGYDYFDVGQAEISGMVGGLRLWLSH